MAVIGSIECPNIITKRMCNAYVQSNDSLRIIFRPASHSIFAKKKKSSREYYPFVRCPGTGDVFIHFTINELCTYIGKIYQTQQ